MAIYGKILGGVLGFALGGPLGALLGAVAGHGLIDRRRAPAVGPPQAAPEADAGAVFALGVIALAAKVAKADGQVTRDEIRAFQRVFPFEADERPRIARLFNEARRSTAGFEAYAGQVRGALASRPELLAEVIDALYAIAAADGALHPEEERMIGRIGALFGLSDRDMGQLRARHAGEAGLAEAYAVLGVAPEADDAALRSAHRQLVRDYHPDRLVSKGLPEDFIALANDRLAAINAAWEEVKKARGLR